MRKMTTAKILFGIIAVLIVAVVSGFAIRAYNQYRYHVEKQTRFMMDTFVTIYTIGPKSLGVEPIKAAFDRMQEVDEKFNSQNPQGRIYAFNHYGRPIDDPEIVDLVRQSLEISRLTQGAFDITVEPLIELWGFYGDSPSLPTEAAVAETVKKIGYEHLHIKDGTLVRDRDGIRIDLGGIAKGYAVREGVAVLKRHGIDAAMIDAGGDVYGLGKRRKELWKVGIRDPRSENIIAMVQVENLAVMGSGDYHRFFIKDQKRYHHIFDPKTGFPAQGVFATSLIHSDPMLADAWNTALFVMGPEKGMAMVEKIPGMEALMVTSNQKILYTTGLADTVQINTEVTDHFARRD